MLTAHTRITGDVLLNCDVRKHDWRKLVPADGVVIAEMMIDTIVEAYNLEDGIADRLEFLYRMYEAQQGKEKRL
jgi:hypothetical protein